MVALLNSSLNENSEFINSSVEDKLFGSKNNEVSNLISISTILTENLWPTEFSIDTRKAIVKINTFKSLKPNWDSYDADEISEIAINNAIEFIKELEKYNLIVYFVSPVRDGGVFVEYQNNNNGKSIEVFFNQDGSNELVLFDNNKEVILEGTVENDFNNVISLYG